MSIKKNDWIAIEYTGKYTDGKVFDSNKDKDPLNFKVGSGMVIQGLDEAVIGLNVGDEKDIKIPHEKAYGKRTDQTTEIPKSAFQDTSVLKKGEELELMSNMGPLAILVQEIHDDKVVAVLNHPLAGKDLDFKVKVIKILDEKEAAQKEQEFEKQREELLKAQQEAAKQAQSQDDSSKESGCGPNCDHSH